MTAEEIELVGGSHDGQVMHIQPAERLHLPCERPVGLAEFVPADGLVAAPTSVQETYRRDVISDRTHRWRYLLERR
ncbi:hypothetical protein [Umezawaea tangerina]|uniref:Uncharacterized protein n=1 Tax=Umezawaea tangerina TaxID=84725 RepID=A0A2T0SPL8_9PSEU|nr:hypothetical protein [Umezawaea tangerina]PRY35359.1 hypothetical protein CLV43_114277 [Umezawaea tangerina]